MPSSPTTRAFLPRQVGWPALVLALILAPALPTAAQTTDDQRVEDYVARLGLTELQALHLERALSRNQDSDVREAMARRLADLYANQMMQRADDPAEFEPLRQRVNALLTRFPATETPALSVMLLQADYARAESHASQWLADSAATDDRDAARQTFMDIAVPLDRHRQTLYQQVARSISQLDDLRADDPQVEIVEQQLGKLQPIAARAAYFCGWSNVYVGILGDAAERAAPLQTADHSLRQMLGIAEQAEPLQAEWLGLESVWRARSVIGLGVAQIVGGNLEEAGTLFDLLRNVSVAPEVQEEAAAWHLQALLLTEQWTAARAMAQSTMANWSDSVTQGKARFCVILVRVLGVEHEPSAATRRELADLGLNALARLGQMKLINQLLDAYQLQTTTGGGFVLQYVRGERLFEQAEAGQQPQDYQRAVDCFQAALKASDANGQPMLVGQTHYRLGWCQYRLQEYEKAAEQFGQARQLLRSFNADAAAQAAWMSFAAWQQLIDEHPRAVPQAIEVLQAIQQDFPNHPLASRSQYAATRLLAGDSLDQLIERLKQIAADDSNYEPSRYDLCLLTHQRWLRADDRAAREVAAVSVRLAVNELLQIGTAVEPARRLKTALLAAEVSLGQDQNNAVARPYLDRAAELVNDFSADDSLVLNYHYVALRAAQQDQDTSAARRHAAQLVEHGRGSAYEVAALVAVAGDLEKRLADAAADAQRQLQVELLDNYRRLVERWGDTADQIRDHHNAQVALSKVAHYAYLLGDPAAAAQALDRLLAVFPNHQDYLRRAGLAKIEDGQFEAALEHWRVLLAGLSSGEDAWYEAKYYQLECLKRTDAEAFQQVYRQLQLLHPTLGAPRWDKKFASLQLP